MPPIPTRLPQETLSLISDAERRYKHITEVGIPNLHNWTGPMKAQQMLVEDLREDTLLLAQQVEELEITVDDLSGEKNRRDLRGIVEDFKSKLEDVRKDTRTALLISKRAIDSKSKSNRDELLTFSATTEKQTSSEKTAEDLLMKTNSDVTDALRRTIALMQNELERSVLSSQLLEESTATLQSTSFQHDVLSSVMTNSKHLITALEKSDWLDRLLILSGFAFFILVVLFIVKQRIVDKGIRIAFWWTRFIPNFSGDEELLRQAEQGVAAAVTEVSSVVASSIAIAASTLSSTLLPSTTPISSDSSLDGELLEESQTGMNDTSEPSSKPTAPAEHIHVEL